MSYKAYDKIPAGCGVSTVLADMDFETYSSAGYNFDETLNKWVSIVKSPPHGIGAVGAPAYSEHHSTEVLSLAYDLKDGLGARLWVPGLPAPTDLFNHINNGGLVEACNSAFEYYIWKNVCVARMGWDELPFEQLRCVASKARAWSLPGALGKTAEALEVEDLKIEDGKRLIKKLCCPRQPTKKDNRRRILSHEDPLEFGRLYDYNVGDIKSESAISKLIPDLSEEELKLWVLDQKINFSGMQIDTASVLNCMAIVDEVIPYYNAELKTVTGGLIETVSQNAKIRSWLEEQGVITKSVDADNVERILKRDDLPADVRRVLEIKELIGSASVKKLFAINRRVSKDGRIRDIFCYHGAATGRWAGRGPQPQNLPNSGPSVKECIQCDTWYGESDNACPSCGAGSLGTENTGWNPIAADQALAIISERDVSLIKRYYGDVITTICGCLRSLFCAAPNKDLICSDYSAIEAVVIAELAGEKWRSEVFKSHGKIYEMSASKISGVPFEEMMEYKRTTGNHHPLRKTIGKVAELACFGPDTQLLTDRGYVTIVDIKATDKLWDGVEWVNQDGVISKGKRKTLRLDGISVTGNHPILIDLKTDMWRSAETVASNKNIHLQARETGSGNLPSSDQRGTKNRMGLWCNVLADTARILCRTLTCTWGSLLGVVRAVGRKAPLRMSRSTASTRPLLRTSVTVADYLIDLAPRVVGVITRKRNNTVTMGGGGYVSIQNGARIGPNSLCTLLQSRGGMYQSLKWTGSTMIKGMNPATLGLSLVRIITRISVALSPYRGKSTPSKKITESYENVYDVLNAGPRNRFTIKTECGHFIVHNSAYQGGIGAWKQFGADKHFDSDEAIKTSIKAWRDESPMIVKFWYGLEDAARSAIQHPGTCFNYRDITYGVKDDVLYCQLPSGRKLSYHSPMLHPETTPWGKEVLKITFMGFNSMCQKWMRTDTYGGKLAENVTQAVARDIMAYAMPRLDEAGYSIVLHVHDEIVSEVPEGVGSIEEFEGIMATMPPWAKDWPIKAAGGWRGKRYCKD